MIDLHCHILPGIDDGAASVEEALEMLRIAEADGIRRIVATPHAAPFSRETIGAAAIQERVQALNRMAAGEEIAVEVFSGSEIRLEPGIVDRIQRGELATLNGTAFVLLELPLASDWPEYARALIYELQLANYAPILAHVERYPAVQRKPELLLDLIASGVLMQVNAASVAGDNRGTAGITAARLLAGRSAHLIASDAHSPRTRAPRIREAYRRAASITDERYARWMLDASESVFAGRPVTPLDPAAPPTTRWWSRFWLGKKR